jgi:nucleoside phosphorylase
MFRVLVTFAAATEFSSWRRMSGFRRIIGEHAPVYAKQIGGVEVYVVITGIGTRLVRNELREFLNSADLCIASGLAGGLRRQHRAGTVLVAKGVKQGGGSQVIAGDESLVKIASQSGATPVECFVTSSVVVSTVSEKQRLGEMADAVDMESFDILRQARECNVPAAAVRAVSDDASTHMPIDFNRIIDERGQIGWLPALYEVSKTLELLPQLIRFGIGSSRATRNLADFLDRYMKALGSADVKSAAASLQQTRLRSPVGSGFPGE